MTKNDAKGRGRLTPEQAKAAKDKRRSACVVSGAGCGKTRVLVEHFLTLVESGTPADQIIAITFTEKAAAEMIERLRDACRQRANEAVDDTARQMWLAACSAVQTGGASTIHSLASRILRAYPFAAGLDPQFAALDETEAQITLAEKRDEELRLRLEQSDGTLRDLLSHYSLDAIKHSIDNLLDKRAAFRDLRKALEVGEDVFAKHVLEFLSSWAQSRARQMLFERNVQEALGALREMKRQREWKPGAETHDTLANAIQQILNIWADIEGGSANGKPIEFSLADLPAVRKNSGRRENWQDAEVKKRAADACVIVKKAMENAHQFLREPGEGEREAIHRIALFVKLSEGVYDRFQAWKRDYAYVDFDDMLRLSLELVRNDAEVRSGLHRRYKCILVDELQDVSPTLWQLVLELAGGEDREGAHLFVVGDAKQSIYRFRQADVRVFLRASESMREAGAMHELTLSFRFHQGLNDFFNDFFPGLMPASEGQEFRTVFSPLRTSRPDRPEAPSVEFLVAGGGEGLNAHEGRIEEAAMIAGRIAQMLSGDEKLVHDRESGDFRAPRPGDIAILIRSTGDLPIYERALREADIEYQISSSTGFYSTQVVTDIHNLARTIAHPDDGLALAGVLRGPLFSVSDNALAILASSSETGLADALSQLQHSSSLFEAREAARLERTNALLSRLRADYGRVNLADLVEQAIGETGYDAYLLGTFMGHQHLANALKLIGRMRKMEENGFTAAETIARFRDLIGAAPHESEAVIADPESEHIQIMTVWKAKGLEFPIVIIPDIGRARGKGRGGKGPVFPQVGLKLPSERLTSPKKAREKSLIDQCIDAIEKEEDTEERKRLLYVAATRAQDHLIFSASKPKKKDYGQWLRWLEERYNLMDRPHGEIVPCGQSGARVIRELPRTRGMRGYSRIANRVLSEIAEGIAADNDAMTHELRASVGPLAKTPGANALFSVTELVQYMFCPARYRFAQVLRLDAHMPPKLLREPPGANRGQAIHRFLELAALGVAPGKAADQAAGAAGLEGSKRERLVSEMTQTLERLAAKGLIGQAAADADERTEHSFSVMLDGRVLTGKFDLLRVLPDRVQVVDYKTGQIPAGGADEKAALYAPQMRLYALAAMKLLPEIAEVETRIVFTEEAAVSSESFGRADLPGLEAEALEAIRGIERGRFDPAPGCAGCEFAGTLCAARGR